MKLTAGYFTLFAAVVAAVAGILFGYGTGVMSGAILYLQHTFPMTPFMNGLVMSMVLIGAFFGSLISGKVTDYFGRKKLLVFTAIIFILGSLGTALSPNLLIFIIGRFFIGLSIGIASYAAPLYISEVSPPKYRGGLVTLNQLAVAFGIFISYVIDYCFSVEHSWRGMLAVGVIPAFFLLVGMFFLPYSPRWMLSQGKRERARAVLLSLRSSKAAAEEEVSAISDSIEAHAESEHTLFSKRVRPALWIAVILAILQQVTGINTILYYSPTIFKMSGFQSSETAILATMGIGAVFVLFTIISIPLIDRWGRRPLLLLGVFLMGLSLLVISYRFTQVTNELLDFFKILALVTYIIGFSIGLGPITWLIISEIFPLKVRGFGASIATSVHWLSNFVVTLTFLSLVDGIGASATFFSYFILSVIAFIFIYLYLPETKGVSLEVIENNLYSGKAWRDLGAVNEK